MSKRNENKEVKRKAKKPKIIRINLSLVIGIIAILFSFFSFILTYKLAIIGTQKLESFSSETLIDEGISTVSSSYSYYVYVELYRYYYSNSTNEQYNYDYQFWENWGSSKYDSAVAALFKTDIAAGSTGYNLTTQNWMTTSYSGDDPDLSDLWAAFQTTYTDQATSSTEDYSSYTWIIANQSGLLVSPDDYRIRQVGHIYGRLQWRPRNLL